MAWLQYAFLFTGIGLLAWGYRRRAPNPMLVGAIALSLGGSFTDLAGRAQRVYEHAEATHRALEAEHAPPAPRG